MILFCNIWLQGHAQAGFSKHFDFGSLAYFNNVLLDNDNNVVVSGVLWNEQSQLLNALIVKFDTLGNIISHNTIEEQGFDLVMSTQNYPFILISDGGYLMTGDMLGCECDFIAKWSIELDLEFIWQVSYQDNVTSFPRKLIEVEDGYLFVTGKQVANLTRDVFVSKIDFDGNILWEYSYGDPNDNEYTTTAWLKNENELIIGAVKLGGPFPGLPQNDCAVSWIFAVDSLGTLKWEWFGDDCDGSAIHEIIGTPDNGWLYTTKQFEAFTTAPLVGETASAPYLVRRDENFNKLWERRLANNYVNNIPLDFLDLKYSSDGNVVAMGDIGLPEPINPFTTHDPSRFTCLYKVSLTGDSIWRQCQKLLLEEGQTYWHRAGGFVELPSGSLIVAGRFINNVDNVETSYGWLYKVDKNGCMHPDDCITTDVEVVHIESNAIKISPNPTSDIVYVESDVVPDEIILLDMSGHMLANVMHRSEIDIRDFPVGVYLLKVRVGEEVYLEKILRN